MTLTRLDKGALVLVTGATGFIGSAVVELLLQKGFKVRGIGRDAGKAATFTEHLHSRFGQSNFEFVAVPDFTVPGAFDAALVGVEGVIHVATDTDPSSLLDTDKALEGVSATIRGLLHASASVSTVKSFVLTSSSAAAISPQYGQDAKVTAESYTDFRVELARSTPVEAGPVKSLITYAATKIYGERAAWRFWEDEKPHYAFNVIIPAWVTGPVANPTPGAYSSHTYTNGIFHTEEAAPLGLMFMNPTDAFVDVRDVAAVHVAALLSTETTGERLFVAAGPYTANDILAIWREAFPERTIRPDVDFPPNPKIEFDNEKSAKLLLELEGRDWIGLRESVIANARQSL